MRRRCADIPNHEPSKKKTKALEMDQSSLDISFRDDEALPPGIIFTDVMQKKWRIGKPIGRGNFGRIYLASDEVDEEVTKLNARYVVKIEPHSNGPLFVEIHCLIRSAQADKVKNWRLQNKKKRLGMPVYIASGSFIDDNTGVKYRFLVLPRYDIDLHKIMLKHNVLDLKNVLVLAIQILDILEYLHNQGYTHSDIKSSNLMIGFQGSQIETSHKDISNKKKLKSVKSKSNYYDDEDFVIKDKTILETNFKTRMKNILSDKHNRTLYRHHAFNLRQLSNCVNYEDISSSICSDRSYQQLIDTKILASQYREVTETDHVFKEAMLSQSNGQIYLLDYGLASKFLDSDGNHKDFGMDARKAHDGTLEYSSRDSHIGAHSRRSDLETLGYNLLDWLTGVLPWKTAEMLAEPTLVHALKKNYMNNIKSLLKTCFKTDLYPKLLETYFDYVTNLDFTEKPNYNYCRSIFQNELVRIAGNADIAVHLELRTKFESKSLHNERENFRSIENDLKLELLRQTLNSSSDGMRKPCVSRNFFISDSDLVARLKKSLMPYDVMAKKLSPKNLRSKRKIQKRKGKRSQRSSIGKFGNFMGSARQFTWAEILAGNPEDIIRKERNNTLSADTDEETSKYKISNLPCNSNDNMLEIQSPLMQKDYLQGMNPTYAMKEVIANFKKKLSGKYVEEIEDIIPGFTPAMMKVYKGKEKREKLDIIEEKPETKKRRCTRSMTQKKVEPTPKKGILNKTQNTNPERNNTRKKAIQKTKENCTDSKPIAVAIAKPKACRKEKQRKSHKERSVPNNRYKTRSCTRKCTS